MQLVTIDSREVAGRPGVVTANGEYAGKGPFWKSMLWFSRDEIRGRLQDDLQRLKVLVEKQAKENS